MNSGDRHRPARSARKPVEPPKPREKKRMTPENYVLWMLGRREHSRSELEVKLRYREVAPDDIQSLLDRMVELGLQSDERFVESQVRIHSQAGKGPRWIRTRIQRLADPALIDVYLPTDKDQWLESARTLIQRRIGEYPLDLAQQRRGFALLLRRGFSHDVARQAMSAPEQ